MSAAVPGLTPDQRRGVETVGKSLLLSAAAGSGKTRVLAERCAYLVCDAPMAFRCDVDELLVVTFTEAAAAEMRDRIGRALSTRAGGSAGNADPTPVKATIATSEDARLTRQIGLLEQAQVSTLHSFCAHLLRQHFHLVGLDPAFSVMDEHEGLLLRLDVGRELIREWHAGERSAQLAALLDGYFEGDEERLLRRMLQMHSLAESLVDPHGWMDAASRFVREGADEPIERSAAGRMLIQLIADRIDDLRARCDSGWVVLRSIGGFPGYEQRVREVRFFCDHYKKVLGESGLDALVDEVAGLKLDKLAPVRNGAPGKDLAHPVVKAINKEVASGRWRELLSFTSAQWRDGMRRVVPHVDALIDLVRHFGDRYRAAKDEARQLDFADLERFTLRVLSDPSGAPSVAAVQYQRHFKHVLVDEYQDINELQNAILQRISRGGGSPEPPNFFAVGDVKQSIYRFRLADPMQFLEREAALRQGGPSREVIDLRQNFRSRGPLLHAINAVFARLMTRRSAEIEYDQTQQLVAGRAFPDAAGADVFPGAPIELHLLPTTREGPAGDHSHRPEAASEAVEDEAADADWDRAEREAMLVGKRILEIVGRAVPSAKSTPPVDPAVEGGPAAAGWPSGPMHVFGRGDGPPRPARFGDIVILLRSQRYKAGQYVRVLEKMGIPAHAESTAGFFESTEVRDVTTLLSLLDNQAQDLPMAAFLRSPIARLPHAEDVMATVRVAFRNGPTPVPFHEAVTRYAIERDDEVAVALRRRLDYLARLRQLANQQPVHETIWSVYHEAGYLTYVNGLPGGRQRSANLLDLYEKARRFGTHRRQDLGRFLSYLEALEEESDLGQPTVATAAQDVVRIMTVHASKGLEFPIVIVPDLGKKIQAADAYGPVLIDRTIGVGLAAVDLDFFARYPSLAQVLARDSIHRKLMAEELRVLYVAVTRAMEHLILVGTVDGKRIEGWERRWKGHSGPLPEATVLHAATVLDWIGPVWAAESSAGRNVIALHRRTWSKLDGRLTGDRERGGDPAVTAALLERRPLSTDSSLGLPTAGELASQVADRLQYVYPFKALTERQAAERVTPTNPRPSKPRSDGKSDPSSQGGARPADRLGLPSFMRELQPITASEKGSATHACLRHLQFSDTFSAEEVRQQIEGMVATGRLAADQSRSIDVRAIEWFLSTDVAALIRRHESVLLREQPIYFSKPTTEQDLGAAGATASETSALDVPMVRGQIDLFVPLADGGMVIDYKTDYLKGAEAIEERSAEYSAQALAYAAAMKRVTGLPVTQCLLVFLRARRIVCVEASEM